MIPKNVKVGYRNFVVKPDAYFKEETYGEIDFNKNEILLGANEPIYQKQETLLHETIHAIENYFDLDLTEHEVTTLSHGLYTVIKNNPDFINFIIE